MGIFKKYIGGIALESGLTSDNSTVPASSSLNTITYHDTTGKELKSCCHTISYDSSYTQRSVQNFSPYGFLTPHASSNSLDNYNFNDYLLNTVGTTTYSKSRSCKTDGAFIDYSIIVKNSDVESITVNSIMFQKPYWTSYNSGSHPILVMGYFLDTPLVIQPNEQRSIVVRFEVSRIEEESKFRKYVGGVALECLQTITSFGESNLTLPAFKYIDGEAHDISRFSLCYSQKNYCENFLPYGYMKAYASSDKKVNFTFNDYQINSSCPCTVTKTRSYSETKSTLLYTIVLDNTQGTDDIEVSSIKFTKEVYTRVGTSNVAKELLVCAYFLDSSITILSGESKTIAIEMKVGTDVSAS